MDSCRSAAQPARRLRPEVAGGRVRDGEGTRRGLLDGKSPRCPRGRWARSGATDCPCSTAEAGGGLVVAGSSAARDDRPRGIGWLSLLRRRRRGSQRRPVGHRATQRGEHGRVAGFGRLGGLLGTGWTAAGRSCYGDAVRVVVAVAKVGGRALFALSVWLGAAGTRRMLLGSVAGSGGRPGAPQWLCGRGCKGGENNTAER